MEYPLCERCGFDENAIAARLSLVELDTHTLDSVGRDLQKHVIGPNADAILDRFYGSLSRNQEFSRIVEDPAVLARIRERQTHYLVGLGIDFHRRAYFEERLRIGSVHQRVGVPQSLYQCTYQGLQSLLIEHIPKQIREDNQAFEAMLQFILKITALDMSLAVESYCMARVSGLKESLECERGETSRLREIAVTDWLTSLHNHSYSRRCLAGALQRKDTDACPLCVIMADLDHFKVINDTHGHLVGDEILRIAASRMISGVRASDEVCRYGGEEFLFILQDTNIGEGKEFAERVRKRINGDEMHSSDTTLTVSISLGVAQARDGDTIDTLIDRADQALYAAKRAGRDCVRTAA